MNHWQYYLITTEPLHKEIYLNIEWLVLIVMHFYRIVVSCPKIYVHMNINTRERS